jgi:hypothetical protein
LFPQVPLPHIQVFQAYLEHSSFYLRLRASCELNPALLSVDQLTSNCSSNGSCL